MSNVLAILLSVFSSSRPESHVSNLSVGVGRGGGRDGGGREGGKGSMEEEATEEEATEE